MKARSIISTIIAVTFAATLAAQTRPPVRRTIVVKDGKVVSAEGTPIPGFEEFLGGKRAFIGVSLLDISPELREHFGAPKDAGVLVESVADDSPAEKAGIKVGDIITAVDGKDVKSSGDLRAALRDKKSGEAVRLETVRNRARQTAMVTVAERENRAMLFPGEVLPRTLNAPEWRAHVENLQSLDCGDLQSRIKDLESRLRDLEKKLQK